MIVVPINVEPTNPQLTDKFITKIGYDLVAEDFDGDAYFQFGGGSASRYVIINGVADSASHKQWEVLFSSRSFSNPGTITNFIEQIRPPAGNPPVITVQPKSQTVTEGATVTLTVEVTGTEPLNYEWHKAGESIPVATAANLVLENVAVNQSGDYTVSVSNAVGTVESEVAKLVVEPKPEAPPALSGPRKLNDGAFEFNLSGVAGRNYHLEFSTDLSIWKPLTTLAGAVTSVPVRDEEAENSQQRFYRVVGQ